MQSKATMQFVLLLSVIFLSVFGKVSSPRKLWRAAFLEKANWCDTYDDNCPQGFHCMIWEDGCPIPPCRLFPICLNDPDVEFILHVCKQFGCQREACFMRQVRSCDDPPCDVTPDCLTEDEFRNPFDPCHGYICPKNYTCRSTPGYGRSANGTANLSCIVKGKEIPLYVRNKDVQTRHDIY